MEVYHEFGNDLVLTDKGDLFTADGVTLSNQAIIRRLLTTPISVASPDYLQNPTYGAGLSQFIGQLNTPTVFNKIKALIISQIYLEATVAQTPPPDVQISGLPNRIDCTITYTYAVTNQQAVINFSFPPTNAN